MLIPNSERILVKSIDKQAQTRSGLILQPGQLKAGENLFVGQVIRVYKPFIDLEGHEHKSNLSEGQIVYYSEYSASQVVDLGEVVSGKQDLSKVSNKKDILIVVAEDDIMAFDDDLTIKVVEDEPFNAKKEVKNHPSEPTPEERMKDLGIQA